MTPDKPTPTRSSVILQALTREVRLRQPSIDTATDLAEITITVKLQAGTGWVRGTKYQEERVMQQRAVRGGS